jgi:hypothetical protein
MTTNSQDLWYYFEKNSNGEPVRRSVAYDKLKNGDFVLSPYTLWKIKLTNVENKHNISFKDLETYKDQISLELSGNGYFVHKDGVKEDLMVDKYYKAIDSHYYIDQNVDYAESSVVPLSHDNSNSSNNLAFSFDGSKNDSIQATTAVDINGDLTLGQLVTHKVLGSNKLIS